MQEEEFGEWLDEDAIVVPKKMQLRLFRDDDFTAFDDLVREAADMRAVRRCKQP